MNIRIGIGYDLHPLISGIPLIIGGCKVEAEKGAKGHSDADVLIHAIIDSLLGAMGEKDIGHHFPDTDPTYKNISSLHLLNLIKDILEKKNYDIINIDSIIILQSPKLSPYIQKMKENIADILKIDTFQIGIKAKTSENLGIIGEEKAIASQAISLLIQKT